MKKSKIDDLSLKFASIEIFSDQDLGFRNWTQLIKSEQIYKKKVWSRVTKFIQIKKSQAPNWALAAKVRCWGEVWPWRDHGKEKMWVSPGRPVIGETRVIIYPCWDQFCPSNSHKLYKRWKSFSNCLLKSCWRDKSQKFSLPKSCLGPVSPRHF